MISRLRSLLLSLFLTAFVSGAIVSAQPSSSASLSDPMTALPASDLVAFANVRRILTDAVPRLLAKDPGTLVKMMAVLNEVKTKTGINILGIDRIALGVRLLGPIGPNFKKESVGVAIVAHGDFDANALIPFAKGMGAVFEQTHAGRIIFSEPPPQPPRQRSERETPAFAVLDANTLVVGDLPHVRASIDALAGTGRVDAALVQHASQDSNALIGWAVTFSPSLVETAGGGSGGQNALERAAVKFVMSNLKEMFASLGSSPTSFNVLFGVRLCDSPQAESLSEMLKAARDRFGGLGGPKIVGLLNNLQISSQGSELRLSADFKDELVQDFITTMMTRPKPAAPPPAAVQPQPPPPPKAKPRTKRRKSSRRRVS